MIKVHRLNGKEVIINSELIESIDSVPDTVINLHTGNRFVIQESMEKVHELIIEYKKAISQPDLKKKNNHKVSE